MVHVARLLLHIVLFLKSFNHKKVAQYSRFTHFTILIIALNKKILPALMKQIQALIYVQKDTDGATHFGNV